MCISENVSRLLKVIFSNMVTNTCIRYDADAESVLTVLALQPLLENKPGNLVAEV